MEGIFFREWKFWGGELYFNLLAIDIRYYYIKSIRRGESDEEAFELTVDEFAGVVENEEKAYMFWLSLADSMWDMGRLTSEVKEKALKIIENNEGLDLFTGSKSDTSEWKRTLRKLKKKLNKAMPERSNAPQPEGFVTNPWNIGDYYAYQLKGEYAKEHGMAGKYITLHKLADIPMGLYVMYSMVEIMNAVYDHVPSLEEVENERILPLVDVDVKDLTKETTDEEYRMTEEEYTRYISQLSRPVMERWKKDEYKSEEFIFIGNVEPDKKYEWEDGRGTFDYTQECIDDAVCEWYLMWRDEDYEIIR